MCGRFQQSSDLAKLQERFGFGDAPAGFTPRWNLAPGQEALVVRVGEGGREAALLRWGLVPAWAQEAKVGYKMINARAEGVADKPAFRGPFRRTRCLVPVDGFYEWSRTPQGKQPYRLALASDEPFALAGLWDAWHGEAEGGFESFTIITTGANQLVRPIHQRMPVMLRPGDEEAWLDPGSSAPALEELLRPFAASEMSATPVSPRLNSPTVEGPELIQPVAVQRSLFGDQGEGEGE